VCRGRRQRNFFSQRLGKLRAADANTLALSDFRAQARDCPVLPVGHRFFQQRPHHAQRHLAFHRRRPGAMLALSASTPPRMKSLRQSRTVSSRTPNASAIRGLVQPANVSRTARARSASPRSHDPASADKPTRWPTDRNLLSLPDSGTGVALQAICELDLSELQAIEPPRGFGRD